MIKELILILIFFDFFEVFVEIFFCFINKHKLQKNFLKIFIKNIFLILKTSKKSFNSSIDSKLFVGFKVESGNLKMHFYQILKSIFVTFEILLLCV